MKDHSHIDEHVWDLLNAQADGELSNSEQQELDALLAGSDELRNIQAELFSFSEYLHAVPKKAPPSWLQNAITSTVRLRFESSSISARRSFSSWLTEHWLGPVFALTAGVLFTVGIYETSPEGINATDTTNMSGTIISQRSTSSGQLIDRLQIDNAAISGIAELRATSQNLLIEVEINSAEPSAFVLEYEVNELVFVGLDISHNQIDGFSAIPGQLTVKSFGEQKYILRFQSPEGGSPINARPFEVDILVGDHLVQQAKLQAQK